MECRLILSINCCNAQCITDTSRSPLGIKDVKTKRFVKILRELI